MNLKTRSFLLFGFVIAALFQQAWAGDTTVPNIESRTFKVDPAAFVSGLQTMDETPDKDVSVTAKKFFSGIGVDLDRPGRSITFNDRLGMLSIKATAHELDTVERAVQALNQVAPQVHLKARFIEAPKKLITASTFFTNAVAGPETGIMSDSNLRTLLHAFHQRDDVETLAEPDVVTISGRQIQMRVSHSFSDLPLLAENGRRSSVSSQMASSQPADTDVEPSLDVMPYVLADGSTINLTTIPEVGHSPETLTTVNLRDNQTFVLGNLPVVSTNGVKADRKILLLITATIVDPAGNRVHADETSFSMATQPQNVASSGFPSPSK